MLAKIGKGFLLAIGILMIMSVTVWDPATITEKAKRWFGLQSGPRADLEGMAPTTGREAVEKKENQQIRELVEGLSIADTRETVHTLSKLPSRVVGYPGNPMAADYVEDMFRSIGLHDVHSQEFEVTVPVDKGGEMTVDGLAGAVELFALWPNEVRTSSLPEGFTGTLMDGKRGEFADFNGRRMTRTAEVIRKVRGQETTGSEEVADAVVLLDFDCEQNWMNAVMLGAKAVVFFDTNADDPARGQPLATRGEAERKFIHVPANIPRFWVAPQDGRRLRAFLAQRQDKQADCKLRSRMVWEKVKTRNILGTIPGTLPPARPSDKVDYERQRIIVLSSFYDAMSVVPRVAPGAENACGMAALLQTARVLKKFPPRHTFVFLAAGSHFHCLWGVQHFLKKSLPTSDELERERLPRGRVDFDLFIGLDLTSRHPQVATTCFGTFYNKWWESNVYRKNLLAPYAKKFTDYAARVFHKSRSEATCPHINAITPPKKTWKNFVPRPLAFDAEAVVARGKDGITLFTPHQVRNLVDTPNDTLERLDLEKLHTQVKTVAALMAKAGRDVQFFTDSKLHLENRIRSSRGNVTWFDRAVNPNIPKAPIPGAVVTFRHPAAGVTNAGVRTLYTTTSQPHNPRGGGPREGYYVHPITLNARRVRISAWSDRIGAIESAEVVIQSGDWIVRPKLRRETKGDVLIRVAERFVPNDDGPVTLPKTRYAPALKERVGRWEAAPPETGKRLGRFVPPEEDSASSLPLPGHAHIKVGNARFRGPVLVPPDRFEVVLDLHPPSGFERAVGGLFGKSYEEVERAADDPDADPDTRIIRSLVLKGSEGTYEVKDVDVAFGQFEGQFVFPFAYFWRWGGMPLLAYKMDDAGSILYAQDEGSQGKETYPNDLRHGGGAQCVLFRCRPLTILEIVDSRYLTVLDMLGLLGPENSVPQQWGARFIAGQSRAEGVTTSASVVFARHSTERDETQPLKIHMGTGLYGIKLLLTNVQLERDGRRVEAPPQSVHVDLGVTRDEARGIGYIPDGRVLLHPTYRVAWDMWVLNEYRLRQLDRYGISNPMLGNFPKKGEARKPFLKLGLHDRSREALLAARQALAERDYERFMAESRRAWGYEAKAYPDVASQADDTVKGVVFYFILLIPFAFFMERLLIGTPDIRKRIAWFAAIFLIVFAVLRYVHPAFKLSSSPYIILLAFIILAMGVIVLFIIVSKFNEEIRKMKQAASGVQQADVGRLSASYAAVILGISNLRKRKTRTTLTAVTLTLLTFTVLSFTSINKTLGIFRLSRGNVPSYQGGLVRDRNWRSLQHVKLDYFRSEFRGATIAPRAWLISKSKKEKEFFEFAAAGGRSNVNGIVGLTPQEVYINVESGPQTMLTEGSRWFRGDWKAEARKLLADQILARARARSLAEERALPALLRGGTELAERQAEISTRTIELARRMAAIDESSGPLREPLDRLAGGEMDTATRSARALRRLTKLQDFRTVYAELCTLQDRVIDALRRIVESLPAADRYACILPDDVAARVGIKPEDLEGKPDAQKPTIRMLGHEFRVIGLIDSEAFNKYRDIDDEKLTPVDTLQEAAKMDLQENPDEAAKAPIQAFTHIESSNTMLIPYALALDTGATLRSIAISHFDGFHESIRRFMERVALNVFVAEGIGDEARVEVLSSIQTTSFSGLGNLFVPILITALIVLNTMTGSVYERFREIQIYSSVGLAPTHIGALFLAEAAVFATIGAVAGYLIGQTVAGVVLHFGWLGAITLNYSSVSTIYSSLVVMLTVFLSALYPAKKAADMAVPDVTRRWKFPPPQGDDWKFEFPFTVGGVEILGMYAYLARFLQSYGETSIGAFYTEGVALAKAAPDEAADYVISARCWLAPYDLGISQDVRFEAVPTGEHNIYAIDVVIHRLSGDTLSWQRMNRGFLNVLRKQFLVWRTVPSGVKIDFADEGRRIVGEAQPEPAGAEE